MYYISHWIFAVICQLKSILCGAIQKELMILTPKFLLWYSLVPYINFFLYFLWKCIIVKCCSSRNATKNSCCTFFCVSATCAEKHSCRLMSLMKEYVLRCGILIRQSELLQTYVAFQAGALKMSNQCVALTRTELQNT